MKLGKPQIPKLSRNTWVAVGGIAATAAAYFLSTRVGSSQSADPFAQAPYSDLGSGATESDERPLIRDVITTAPSQFAPPASEMPAYSTPAAVTRAKPASSAPSAPAYYVDRLGQRATLAEIFNQRFDVAQPVATPLYQAPAPQRTYAPPAAPVDVSSIPDRFRSLFGLAPTYVPAASREGYSTPPASTSVVSYPDPIVASSLKFPGGGLASPLGVETYIGGGGQDLVQRRGEWSAGSSAATGFGDGGASLAA